MSQANGHGPAALESLVVDDLPALAVPAAFFDEFVLTRYRPEAEVFRGRADLEEGDVFRWGGVNWLVAGVASQPRRAVCYTVLLEAHYPGKRKAVASPHTPGAWAGLGVTCNGVAFRLCHATAFVAEGKRRGRPSGN